MNIKRVLFICTGNYYRSRYAELLFNYLANTHQLHWEAFSRGTEVFKYQNEGPVSKDTIKALNNIFVMDYHFQRFPTQVDEKSLELADIIIALKKAEHQEPLKRDFPQYEKKVIYWNVHDLDAATCEEAFCEINDLVKKLIEKIRNGSSH